MRFTTLFLVFLVCSWDLAGCGTATSPGDAGGSGADAGSDTGTDGGSATPDAGTDAGTDAGAIDAGPPPIDAAGRTPQHHRASDAQCQASAPAGNCSFGGGAGECSMDSDCTSGTNGRCNMNNGGAAFCRCTYDTCAHDTDCATGETCACHGADFHPESNECVAGNCRVDADCGAGGFCSPTIGGCGGLGGYYCHTAGDLCLDDTDCTGLEACQYATTSARWECIERLFCP